MPGTHPATESSDGLESERRGGILHKLPDLTYLTLLGFLSIPGYLFAPLRPLRWFVLFFLFGLWPLVRGLIPSSRNERTPTEWIAIGGKKQKRRTLLSFLLLQLNPFVQVKSVLQLAGHVPILARYRGRLPKPGQFEQTASYRLPFDSPKSSAASTTRRNVDSPAIGTWTVVNGSPNREHSHSWGILTQRYAYDFVITDGDGRTHAGDGSRPEDYYCYGEPIVSPADGVVVAARDGHRDHHRAGGWLDPRQRDVRGNWVTIEHADGEYAVLAHLQCGSIEVEPGDHVKSGQRIGRCGHSGNSTEPHLHFHVQDRPTFYLGMGLPIQFDDVRTATKDGTNTAEGTATERTFIAAGQRVLPNSD